jgi:hypothetical protein
MTDQVEQYIFLARVAE